MGSWVERTYHKAAGWRTGAGKVQLVGPVRQWPADWVVPHSWADKPEGTTREQDGLHNPEFQCGVIKPEHSE